MAAFGSRPSPGAGTRVIVELPDRAPSGAGRVMTLVLVVDDIPALADQYAYDLKRLGGYDVLTAADGRQALDLLDRDRRSTA